MTFRFAANDILETFNQTFDDKKIQLTQVIYWLSISANRLNKLHFDKANTGLYLNTFRNVVVKIEAQSDRKFIELPAQILDLNNEKAVRYMSYNEKTNSCCDGPSFAQTTFGRTTPPASQTLYSNPHMRPSPSNPYFYRSDGDKLFLLGLECVDITDVEVGLMTALDPTKICDLDDQLPLPEHLVQTMRAEVINMGRLAYLLPTERTNEGTDSSSENARNVPQEQTVQTQETE